MDNRKRAIYETQSSDTWHGIHPNYTTISAIYQRSYSAVSQRMKFETNTKPKNLNFVLGPETIDVTCLA